MRQKIILTNILISIMCIIANITYAVRGEKIENPEVVIQSKETQDTLTQVNITDLFYYAREMECEGGALGLNAVINMDGTENTTNNIDSHLIKNTEYGAVILLTASQYGQGKYNTSNINSVASSSTGNKYGIYQLAGNKWEYTTGILMSYKDKDTGEIKDINTSYTNVFRNTINNKYYDIYHTEEYNTSLNAYQINPEEAIQSDGYFDSLGWWNATATAAPRQNSPFFVRGNGGVFGSGARGRWTMD